MTKYLSSEPFSESAGGSSSDQNWRRIFGRKTVLRCPNKCPVTRFTQRRNLKAWACGGDPDEMVCSRCGTAAVEEEMP